MAKRNWKGSLRPASFRGVRFHVSTAEREGGRRGATHEFAGRDTPYREDLGRKARDYPVEGYLVGAEYLGLKNQLLAALEKEGAGDLIHPYYGKIRVCVDNYSMRESSAEGGYVRFTMKFVEAGELAFPKSAADGKSLVGAAGAVLGEAASGAFEKAFSVANQAQFVVDSADEKVTAFASSFDTFTAASSASAAAIANLAFGIRDLKSNVKDLLGKPAELAEQMKNSIALLVAAGNPSDIFAAMKGLFGFGDDDAEIPRTTSSRDQQHSNSTALNLLVQTIAVTAAADAATDLEYPTVQDAAAVRDQIAEQLDALMDTSTSDEVFSALQDLRAQVVQAIPPADQAPASLAQFTPQDTVPSIVLAFELYGSLDLEEDLIARNKIEHPGFVPGGKPLEVIDRG